MNLSHRDGICGKKRILPPFFGANCCELQEELGKNKASKRGIR